MESFADRLVKAVKEKKSAVCVGLDPKMEKIPEFIKKEALEANPKDLLKASAEALITFNKGIIDAVANLVPVVKPQFAFYAPYGAEGMRAFAETIAYAKSKGLLTIADAKSNDIGSTAEMLANTFLGETTLVDGSKKAIFDADCLTVTPYPGWDGIKPFVDVCEKNKKGIFIWVKSSNPSGGDLQDLVMADQRAVYEIMGHFVDSWGADSLNECGYSSVGAVVGATYPAQAKKLREIMPETLFLVPGYGAQGAGAEDIKHCFNKDGLGAIVNSSRGIIFAYENAGYTEDAYDEAAKDAVIKMNREISEVL